MGYAVRPSNAQSDQEGTHRDGGRYQWNGLPFMTERKYRRDRLFKEDDAATEMFLTVTGRFLSRKLASNFRRDVSWVNLAFTPINGEPRPSKIEDGIVLTITYEKLLEIYFQNPQFGYYFRPDQPTPAGEHFAAGRTRCS